MIEEILSSIRQAEEKAEQIKLDADKKAENILFDAGEEVKKISTDFKNAAAEYRLNKQTQVKQQAEKEYKNVIKDGEKQSTDLKASLNKKTADLGNELFGRLLNGDC